MGNKAILVSFIAILLVVFAVSTVIASDTENEFVKLDDIVVNDISVFRLDSVAGVVSEVIPVAVKFTAKKSVSDVRVKVYIEGYKDEISETTPRFHIVENKSYIKRFSIRLPSSTDLDDLIEDLSLLVRISSKGYESLEFSHTLGMQKEIYSLNFLSIESVQTSGTITPGSTAEFDIVIQNNGNEWLDNTYVRVSIPELSVSRKVYFGDLSPFAEGDLDDIMDSVNKKVYLTIPKNAVPGVYNAEVEAYNYDTSTLAKKKIVIQSIETEVLPAITSKTISGGEETTFDIVLVNPSNKIVVYSIRPEESKGLIVDVSEPIVAVSSDSSKTVKVKVKATESAEEGTYVVTVNVNSESGEEKVNFSVNVEEPPSAKVGLGKASDTVVILTVVLVIVFVVLLIILIVLLTKRPEKPEEFGEETGETSYY